MGIITQKLVFTRFSIPLIKKTYPRLIASTLASVQPMVNPVSDIAHTDIIGAIAEWVTEYYYCTCKSNDEIGFIEFIVGDIRVIFECQSTKLICRCFNKQHEFTTTFARFRILPVVFGPYLSFRYEDPDLFDRLSKYISEESVRILSLDSRIQ